MSNRNETQQAAPFVKAGVHSASVSAPPRHRWREVYTEFRAGWPVLATGALGSALGMASLPVFALPLFLGPLQDAFGWPRGEIGLAMTILTLMIFLGAPVAGRLADRAGARPVILVSILLFVVGMLAISQVSGSIWWFYAGYLGIGLGGAGTTYVTYSRAVCVSFKSSRGMALGAMMSGPGIIAASLPLVIPSLINLYGWRGAWMMMGAAALVPFALVFFLFRNTGKVGVAAAVPVAGIPLRQARRMRQFWLMVIATFLLTFALTGTYVHFIGILNELGLQQADAFRAASVLGVSMMAGRIICGSLLDIVFAPLLGAVLVLLAAVALLFAGQDSSSMVLAVAIGVVFGMEVDFMAYIATRYFGLLAYSEIFGWVYGAMALGSACSPFWLGRLHDATNSYRSGFLVSAGLLICGAACIAALGRYPASLGRSSRQQP